MSIFVVSAIAIMSKDNALCIKCIMRIFESLDNGNISKQKANLFYKLCSIVGPTKFTSCSILLMKDIMYIQNIKYTCYDFNDIYDVNEENLHVYIERVKAKKDALHIEKLIRLADIFEEYFKSILSVRKSLIENFLYDFDGYNEIYDKTSFIESFRKYIKLKLENGCYYENSAIFPFAKELDIWCDTNYIDIIREHGLQHYYVSFDMEGSINPILDVPDVKRTRFVKIFNKK